MIRGEEEETSGSPREDEGKPSYSSPTVFAKLTETRKEKVMQQSHRCSHLFIHGHAILFDALAEHS